MTTPAPMPADAPFPVDPVPVTINGVLFNVPLKFHVGHVLTAREARSFQAFFRDCIRNNKTTAVKKVLAQEGLDGNLGPISDEIWQYAMEFNFGRKSSTTQILNSEMKKLAMAQYRARVAQGIQDDVSGDELELALAAIIQNNPEIEIEAERRAEAILEIASVSLDDLI